MAQIKILNDGRTTLRRYDLDSKWISALERTIEAFINTTNTLDRNCLT